MKEYTLIKCGNDDTQSNKIIKNRKAKFTYVLTILLNIGNT